MDGNTNIILHKDGRHVLVRCPPTIEAACDRARQLFEIATAATIVFFAHMPCGIKAEIHTTAWASLPRDTLVDVACCLPRSSPPASAEQSSAKASEPSKVERGVSDPTIISAPTDSSSFVAVSGGSGSNLAPFVDIVASADKSEKAFKPYLEAFPADSNATEILSNGAPLDIDEEQHLSPAVHVASAHDETGAPMVNAAPMNAEPDIPIDASSLGKPAETKETFITIYIFTPQLNSPSVDVPVTLECGRDLSHLFAFASQRFSLTLSTLTLHIVRPAAPEIPLFGSSTVTTAGLVSGDRVCVTSNGTSVPLKSILLQRSSSTIGTEFLRGTDSEVGTAVSGRPIRRVTIAASVGKVERRKTGPPLPTNPSAFRARKGMTSEETRPIPVPPMKEQVRPISVTFDVPTVATS